jgi:large subunit ribosomal protein L13
MREYKFDLKDKTLGRSASEIAKIILGKDTVNYAPNKVTDAIVYVSNVDKMNIPARKMLNNKYYTHSGYLGSLKEKSLKDFYGESPEKLFMLVLKRMIPDNRLRDIRLNRVKFIK